MSEILTGPKVTLRPIGVENAEAMFASLNDPIVRHMTATRDTYSLEQVRKYCAAIGDDEDRADFAIFDNERPDIAVGEVSINEADWDNRMANYRIALYGEAFIGKGYGSAATRLVLAYGFNQMNLHRIDLEVYEYNQRAIAMYEHIGFVREGVKRDALYWEGRFHDVILMSLLRHEFAG